MYGQAFNILKTRSFAIRTSRVLASTAWARVDMEFLFVFNSEEKISKYTGVMQNDCPVILHHVTQSDQYYCANINLSQRLKSKRNIERGKKKGQ